MCKNEIEAKYFDWIYALVIDPANDKRYKKLLTKLFETRFDYILEMDGNRAEDGIDLRYRFGNGLYGAAIIAHRLDYRDCSVLEMMAALALRCEEHIMSNVEFGDRTKMWFMLMLSALGLDNQRDDVFDEKYVDKVLKRFLNREYERDGTGGLFVIKNPERDMRTAEIWKQMMWFLNEYQSVPKMILKRA